jgi:glycosyltransferase involved in cell wall biosynthesis
MKPLPKLSVIIPSYNQRDFLAKALDSLACQDYPNLEVIVVDGASRDGTVELLQARGDVVSRWLSEPDSGQTQALNKGFALATGEVFGWLNTDERYRPGTLRLLGQIFAEDPDLDIVFGHRVVVDRQGKEIGRMRAPAMHPRSYALFGSGLLYSDATFWKADLHRRTGELDEINCPRYGMDFDWFARMGLKVRRWQRIEAYLSEFTERDDRVSRDVPEMAEIAYQIRQRLQRLAGVGPLQVMLKSPWYFIRCRYGQFGWRGLLRPPAIKSLLRVAGLVR